MVTFQISINGQPYCESEDITVLMMVVEEIRRREGCRISLHARGTDDGTLQWLAAHLGVGDEIVIRIVEAAEQEVSGPLCCGFCGREAHEVSNLIAGQSAYISDRCIQSFSTTVINGTELPLGASICDDPEWMCGFCAKHPGTIPGVVVRNGAAVCPECLHACSDILIENSGDNASNES